MGFEALGNKNQAIQRGKNNKVDMCFYPSGNIMTGGKTILAVLWLLKAPALPAG
jgi:hypothetical protein